MFCVCIFCSIRAPGQGWIPWVSHSTRHLHSFLMYSECEQLGVRELVQRVYGQAQTQQSNVGLYLQPALDGSHSTNTKHKSCLLHNDIKKLTFCQLWLRYKGKMYKRNYSKMLNWNLKTFDCFFAAICRTISGSLQNPVVPYGTKWFVLVVVDGSVMVLYWLHFELLFVLYVWAL